MSGLISYGAYVPFKRLKRSEISGAMGSGRGKGTRAVASYDEDTSTMAVEAGRMALRGLPDGTRLSRLLFSTTAPAYADKTNANVVHAALRLKPSALTMDAVGSVRSSSAALMLGAESPHSTLVTLSDIRTGLPGSADESDGGDAAAALVFGNEVPPIAEVLACSAVSAEFLDRWRSPTSTTSTTWEERFAAGIYIQLAETALDEACKQAGLARADIDVLIASGTHSRAVRSFSAASGISVANDLSSSLGYSGAAHSGVVLSDVLDRAESGHTIALVVLADGATAMLLRTTDALNSRRQRVAVADQIEAGSDQLSYSDFLTWRGFLDREPPRRPDPSGAAAPPAWRSVEYKYGFVGHRCTTCGTLHLPAVRVCINCKAIDQMEDAPMADALGRIATFTIDRLAYSPSSPVVAVVVDFDGGGRFTCELTDAYSSDIAVGDEVEMTFRRILTARGIHNYFWKARPLRLGPAQSKG